MKFKAILVSLTFLAVAWGSMANATTIGTGDNIGFTMVNANNTSSWTLDLGVSVSDLAAGTVGTFSINVLDELGLAEMVDGYSWSVLGGIQEGISAFGYFATLKSSVTPNNKTSAQTAGAISQIDNYFTDNGNGTNGPVPNGATGFYNNAGSFQGDCNGACAPVARGNEETVPMDGSSMMPFYFQQAISGVESQANLLGTFTLLDDGTLTYAPVPIPAAVWMFGSVIAGMFGFARARKAKQ